MNKRFYQITAALLLLAVLIAGTTYDIHVFQKAVTFNGALNVDTVTEVTAANGVTIDSVALKDGGATLTAALNVQDSDAGQVNVSSTCVTETTDSGASTDTITACIPAGATTFAVTCRVDTILAGAGLTTWSLGDGTDADLYGTTLALAEGTTVDESDYTASPRTQAWSASAGDLTMTAAAGQFDSGSVTCCCHYYHVTAPAS